MRVFVTGHRGYIGSHLVDVLKREGHTVVGCDLGLFDGCGWEEPVKPDVELVKDTRTIGPTDLDGCECIMHLAAISNDLMGATNAQLTLDINRDASGRLARLAKQVGVPRYLFAGSCSVYGRGEKLDLDESAPLGPLSVYAQSKVEAEKAIAELADASFSPTFLRNSTAYGHSPMLRIDLVANNLLASALAYGEIRIHSDGTPWRPLIHCRDIARAFAAFARAPRSVIHNKAVNVGGNNENYRVCDVATQVQRLIPSAKIAYTGGAGPDPRNYRVNFDLLHQLLPDFKLEHSLRSGMEELYRKMVEHGFSVEDFEGERFVRLRTLGSRLHLLI
jgi:nucleoside-diphosphate-sugar epimerase